MMKGANMKYVDLSMIKLTTVNSRMLRIKTIIKPTIKNI